MNRTLGQLAAYTVLAGMALSAAGETPKTEARPVKQMLHGVEVVDPYRWLEGDEKGNLTDDVNKWTDEQNAHTRKVLDSLPGREKLEKRLRELMQVTTEGAPQTRKNRYFFTRRERGQNQPVVYVRESSGGTPRAMVNVNAMDKDGLIALAWIAPDQSGKLLAFGTYRAGDENSVCRILEVDTGRWLADEIEGKVGSVQWMPDSRGFFYERLADVKNPYSAQIRFHRLGDHARQDPILFEQYKEGPLATTWGPSASISRDGRWMVLSYHTSTKSNDLWAVDLDRWFRSGDFVKSDILVGSTALSSGPILGDTLYMETTLDAPNGRVIAVDLNEPSKGNWKEFVAEKPDAVIRGIELARGILAITYQKNAYTTISLKDPQGKWERELELPGIGTARLSTNEDRTEAFVTFTSFNHPTTIFRTDLKTGERSVWFKPEIPVDPATVEVKQVFYPSKDGTKVSMFIVHKKGVKLDGDNPTILYGYGGFGIPMTPSFDSTLFPWLEAGGVYAVANLRGGSEYGDKWHEAGMLDRKQNVFDDFIAAAQWLIDNKYTKPSRLGIEGGSNGGLLTGAALVQRPELFGAVISAVPLLDMLRYQDFLMARYWVPEYGSAEKAEQFEYLRKYSPYHNVKPGTKYPAVLLTAGENDTRVHPLHARKMAALLQASTAGDSKEDPILLWVDRSAGHGAGKPLNLRIRDEADQRIFMMWQLGMLADQKKN